MNSKNNISITDEGLNDAPLLSELQGKNSLAVPDGYFDKLQSEILSKVDIAAQPSIKSAFNITKVLYFAAAASIIVLLGFIVFKSSDKAIAPENFIVEHDAIIENITPKTIEKKNIIIDSSAKEEMIVENDIIEKQDVIENTAIVNNNKSNKKKESFKLGHKANKQPVKFIEQPEEEEFIVNNEVINNDGFNNSSSINSAGGSINTSASQQQNSSSNNTSQSIARIAGNILLPKDTCVNKAFVYSILNDTLMAIWSNGSKEKSIKIKETSIYWVQLYYGEKLIATDTMKVSIVDIPEPNINPDIDICNYQKLLLNTGLDSKVYTHNWSLNSYNKSEILLENLEPGTQDIGLKISSCCDTVSYVFTINVQDCKIVIPNVFTPNGDGYNDAFVVKGLEYYPNSSLNIFDRNGRLVYSSTDYKNNWKAQNTPSGNYFYSLIINDDNHTEKGGIVNIMR